MFLSVLLMLLVSFDAGAGTVGVPGSTGAKDAMAYGGSDYYVAYTACRTPTDVHVRMVRRVMF